MSNTLVILGAGASRGEVLNKHCLCYPPLNNDFFIQFQKCASVSPGIINKIIPNVVKLYGTNFDVTLEDLFTQIEFLIKTLKRTEKESKDFNTIALREFKSNLLQAIAIVFHQAISSGNNFPCHSFLVQCLSKAATIISLNYDCIVDSALKSTANKWNPQYGYGISTAEYDIINSHYWIDDSTKLADKKDTIMLLKLHGSLNWILTKNKKYSATNRLSRHNRVGKIKFKQHPYKLMGDKHAHFEIVPPEWHKALEEPLYTNIWREAAARIHKAKTIICIGYSFPWTDLHTSSLFRASINNKKGLDLLVQVDPDKSARRRAREVFSGGMKEKTRVLTFTSFNEFYQAIQESRELQEMIFQTKLNGTLPRTYGTTDKQLTGPELKKENAVQQNQLPQHTNE